MFIQYSMIFFENIYFVSCRDHRELVFIYFFVYVFLVEGAIKVQQYLYKHIHYEL